MKLCTFVTPLAATSTYTASTASTSRPYSWSYFPTATWAEAGVATGGPMPATHLDTRGGSRGITHVTWHQDKYFKCLIDGYEKETDNPHEPDRIDRFQIRAHYNGDFHVRDVMDEFKYRVDKDCPGKLISVELADEGKWPGVDSRGLATRESRTIRIAGEIHLKGVLCIRRAIVSFGIRRGCIRDVNDDWN
ncbi:hypothetical protein KVT40_001424 [Elsinoe batatas]|uniref:Uncharacterized protein n=1 Tax=Elsinoe batatas TaxID=2601811 RepID=A0A8K0PF18_9PEZI|nr:hypothetical protein KVT40_001424 [Elsinoe batatas]